MVEGSQHPSSSFAGNVCGVGIAAVTRRNPLPSRDKRSTDRAGEDGLPNLRVGAGDENPAHRAERPSLWAIADSEGRSSDLAPYCCCTRRPIPRRGGGYAASAIREPMPEQLLLGLLGRLSEIGELIG